MGLPRGDRNDIHESCLMLRGTVNTTGLCDLRLPVDYREAQPKQLPTPATDAGARVLQGEDSA